jgi:hypothetical protein
MASIDTLRVLVSLNGDRIPGLLRASITTTNHFSADTYALTFALDTNSPADLDFWAILSSGLIELTAVITSVDGPIYQGLITGMIDTVHIDPIQGIVAVEGRDLSSTMIDSYRQQDFVNQTASEVVATIAQYHNLNPVVAPTSGTIGRYYSDGYTRLSLGQFSRLQSDWDLVVQLARENNFDIFVEGQSLYFQPSGGPDQAFLQVSLRDVQSVRIERNLGISADIAAKVQSWSSQNMVAYDSSNPGDSALPTAEPTAPTQSSSFLFSGSNYTSSQASDAAARYVTELGRLRTVLNFTMPWDLSLVPRVACLFLGTQSGLDTFYLIDSVERQYSSVSGSKQQVRAVLI